MPDVSKNFPLIIRPKEKQNFEKTKAELNKKVDPINCKITNVENWRNGIVCIRNENIAQREKIKEAMENEIKVQQQVEMQIIITDMDFKLSEKDLIDKLKQNGVLQNSEMEMIKKY